MRSKGRPLLFLSIIKHQIRGTKNFVEVSFKTK